MRGALGDEEILGGAMMLRINWRDASGTAGQ
jgi:hypothetical protein